MFDNNQANKNSGVDLNQINNGKPYPFTPVNNSEKKLSGLKGPVEDMLAGTENINAGKIVSDEKNSNISLKETPQVPLMDKPLKNQNINNNSNIISNNVNDFQNIQVKKSPIIFLIIILIVALFVSAGFFAYKYLTGNKNNNNNPQIDKEESNKKLQNLLNDLKNTSDEKRQQENSGQKVNNDTDGDGLFNDQEIELGTNPSQSDTDFDGLTDFEEINNYKTNPIKQDTDADGYNDGNEVKNGYDPALPGDAKLLN